jgi:hypothetical protein
MILEAAGLLHYRATPRPPPHLAPGRPGPLSGHRPDTHCSHATPRSRLTSKSPIWACETGLRTNPGDLVLLNNLAFSQASLGQIDKAAETIAKLPLTVAGVRKLATWTATRGLIAFRRGDAVLGRRLYQESIASWQRQGGRKEAAKAATYWAREELLAGTDHIGEALAAVRELGKNVTSDPETDILRERLRRLAISMIHGAE